MKRKRQTTDKQKAVRDDNDDDDGDIDDVDDDGNTMSIYNICSARQA